MVRKSIGWFLRLLEPAPHVKAKAHDGSPMSMGCLPDHLHWHRTACQWVRTIAKQIGCSPYLRTASACRGDGSARFTMSIDAAPSECGGSKCGEAEARGLKARDPPTLG